MAGEACIMAADGHIQGLEHQLARLTEMIQTGVKLETICMEQCGNLGDHQCYECALALSLVKYWLRRESLFVSWRRILLR